MQGHDGNGQQQEVVADVGQVHIAINWPPPPEVDTQLIPACSNSIAIQITDDGETIAQAVVVRPSEPPWTTDTTLEGVLATDDAVVTAAAYPNEDGTGGRTGGGRNAHHNSSTCRRLPLRRRPRRPDCANAELNHRCS